MIADETLAIIFGVAGEWTRHHGGDVALVTGKIHEKNDPCEALVSRWGFEPVSIPSGGYQLWAIGLSS